MAKNFKAYFKCVLIEAILAASEDRNATDPHRTRAKEEQEKRRKQKWPVL